MLSPPLRQWYKIIWGQRENRLFRFSNWMIWVWIDQSQFPNDHNIYQVWPCLAWPQPLITSIINITTITFYNHANKINVILIVDACKENHDCRMQIGKYQKLPEKFCQNPLCPYIIRIRWMRTHNGVGEKV